MSLHEAVLRIAEDAALLGDYLANHDRLYDIGRDDALANASKIHEGKDRAEAIRRLIDVTGGFVAHLPSDRDFNNPEIGGLLKKYLKGATGVPVEKRIRMLRLIEKMAMESADTISDIHGGGSPEAHRLTIYRETHLNNKKNCAKRLAGIED